VYFVEYAHARAARSPGPSCSHDGGNERNARCFEIATCGCWRSGTRLATDGSSPVVRWRQSRRWEAEREEGEMIWTIFVILVVAWLLGMVSSYTFGGFLHLLLVLAVAVVLINIISGRRAV
jgi:hypothetical protein